MNRNDVPLWMVIIGLVDEAHFRSHAEVHYPSHALTDAQVRDVFEEAY